MRMLSSSAALAALCSLLVVSGGCGGNGTSEGDGSGPALTDGELGGAPARGEAPAAAEENASGWVTICHVPPGNPANAHTLVVSWQGWENGHQRHPGDTLDACPVTDTTEPDAGTTEPDAGQVCAPVDSTCGGDEDPCCSGLECREGFCRAPVIIN